MHKIINVLSKDKVGYLLVNIVIISPLIFLLVHDFNVKNIIIAISLILVLNFCYFFYRKEKKKVTLYSSYLSYLESLTLFTFSFEEDFISYLDKTNNANKNECLSFYNDKTTDFNSLKIYEQTQNYLSSRQEDVLEELIHQIENEQEEIETKFSSIKKESSSLLPFLLILVFFGSFIISLIFMITGGYNA